jgi:hypothetical protein
MTLWSIKSCPPSTNHRLTSDQLVEVRALQKAGITIGEVAELHGITIREAEDQLGVEHRSDGKCNFNGIWRPRAEVR